MFKQIDVNKINYETIQYSIGKEINFTYTKQKLNFICKIIKLANIKP